MPTSFAPDSTRRSGKVGLPERRVKSGAKLVGIQSTALLLVPFRKPFLAQGLEFLPGQFAVLVLVSLLQKGRRNEHRGTEPTRSARPAKTPRSSRTSRTTGTAEKSAASFGLHRLPLIGAELEMHRPDVRAGEEFGRLGRPG